MFSKHIERRNGSVSHETLSERQRPVDTIKGADLRGATIALPSGISLDDHAARMNASWKALVDLQYDDVTVIAVAAKRER